jgi:hypothetical protein
MTKNLNDKSYHQFIKLWSIGKRSSCIHYAKMWFLWWRHVATTTQNNHVVVSALNSQSFNDYSHNCESTIINMIMIITKGNYDYIYDYMIKLTILKYLLDLVWTFLLKN